MEKNTRNSRRMRSYEEDSSPRNMPSRPRLERQDPLPSGYGEGYTPAPGEIPMRPAGTMRRMKKGGVVRGDGIAKRGKTKGRMV
jgi:hypothetical protein